MMQVSKVLNCNCTCTNEHFNFRLVDTPSNRKRNKISCILFKHKILKQKKTADTPSTVYIILFNCNHIFISYNKSCLGDLNPRPPPYQGDALPTEPRQPVLNATHLIYYRKHCLSTGKCKKHSFAKQKTSAMHQVLFRFLLTFFHDAL